MRVLLTGFGPFPGVPVNATMRLVPAIAAAARRALPDVRIRDEILTTAWQVAPDRVAALLAEARPDVALHFGVSGRARGFEIEMRAVNRASMRPDAAGASAAPVCLDETAGDFIGSTFRGPLIVARLRQLGLPAFISRDAGTYLCNAVLFRSLACSAGSGTRTGFIHIPASLAGSDGTRAGGRCPLTWDEALEGGVEIVATALGRPPVRIAMSGGQGVEQGRERRRRPRLADLETAPVA
ncbi:MAG: pyroglutamyl-peptidase I [Hyphomicrobiaceae bacterium]